MKDHPITRRRALTTLGALGLAGAGGLTLQAPRRAHAQTLGKHETVDEALKRIFGARPMKDGGDIVKVRVRLPSSIKPGDVVRVRSLVIHPMERIERDSKGKIIDKKYLYINRVVATYLGKTVATFDTTQSVSENPTFVFSFRATD